MTKVPNVVWAIYSCMILHVLLKWNTGDRRGYVDSLIVSVVIFCVMFKYFKEFRKTWDDLQEFIFTKLSMILWRPHPKFQPRSRGFTRGHAKQGHGPSFQGICRKCSHTFYVTKTENWSALKMNECPLEKGPFQKKSRRTSNMLVFSSIELLKLTSFLVSKWPWFWSARQTPHKFWVVCFDITSTLYESARWQKDTTLVVP